MFDAYQIAAVALVASSLGVFVGHAFGYSKGLKRRGSK